MEAWLDFWDADNSIYVCRRHLQAHYEGLLADVLPLLPASPCTLLDYGCGEALMAPELARRGVSVLLYDQSPHRQEALARRFDGIAGITVLDQAGLAALAPGSVDRVLVISVIQYVARAELPALLGRLRTLLAPQGRLVLGDILGPDAGVLTDAAALLRFAAGHGFLWLALRGLLHTLRSDYRRLRQQVGLSTYTPAQLVEILAGVGLEARVLPHNIGHAGHRRSLVAAPNEASIIH